MSSSDAVYFNPALIVDIGSCYVKAGFAGDSKPILYFPTVIGYPEYSHSDNEFFVGEEAIKRYDTLKIEHPMRFSIISDWGAFTDLIRYIVKILGVDPANKIFVYIYRVLSPLDSFISVSEILFEDLGFNKIVLLPSELLSAVSLGLKNALIIDSGCSITNIVSITYPRFWSNSFRRMPIGGQEITTYLAKLLYRRGIHVDLNSLTAMKKVEEIKEKYCYLASDYREELKRAKNDPSSFSVKVNFYGRELEIAEERFMAPEVLYIPLLVGREIKPLSELIIDSISSMEPEYREDLYRNIVLVGGNVLLKNFRDRLYSELKKIVPSSAMDILDVKIHPAPHYSAFLGASIMASLPEFNKIVITRKQWKLDGPDVIFRFGAFFSKSPEIVLEED